MLDNQIIENPTVASIGKTNKEVLDKIEKTVIETLKEYYPNYVDFDDRKYTVEQGSTVVMIQVRDFTSTDACVECTAQVVTGCRIDNELMHYLLKKNTELYFGAFGIIFDDTITFSHNITGSNMNKDEFLNSVKGVGLVSDFYDDKIVEVAGGKRACDLDSESLEESL
ncbi:MAG: YbjN domain-containing protein [Candidatus Kapaibacteriales bacterium]